MSKSLTDKTISGLNWSLISTNALAIINIVVGIILARLLLPQDFGLLGMTYIFIGLAELFVTMGMGSAVQRIKSLSNDHIRVATTITIIFSIFIYLILFFSAPYLASFYNEPRIINIVRVLSIVFLIQGLVTVSYGRIRRELNFKYILKIDLSSNLIGYGLTSSVLAFLGFGVWSLVYGRIISAVISAVLIMLRFPVILVPSLNKVTVKELIGFGTGISLSNFLFYVSSNIDMLIIGKYLNSYSLGLYTRSLNLMKEALTKITGGIYNVLFPAFALAQDDTQKLNVAYLRTVKTITYFIYPILISMVILAEITIKGLFGAKWEGAIASFQILGIAGILRTTLPYSGALAHATGNVYKEAFQQLVYLIILGITAFYAVRFGIEGVALATLAASLWLFISQSTLSLKIIKTSWKQFFVSMIPGFSNMVVMMLCNILIYFILEHVALHLADEIKLFSALIINFLIFIIVIVFMPAKFKSDTFDWLIEKYEKYFPRGFLNLYRKFNPNSSFQKL